MSGQGEGEFEKSRSLFEPITMEPAPHIVEFLKSHPHSQFDAHLWTQFLLANYPQADDQGVDWVLEGGYAVELLRPGLRPVGPGDIDVVCRSQSMESAFHHSNVGRSGFDVKTVERWLALKGLVCTAELGTLILSSCVEVEFEGQSLLVMEAPLIAAGKSLPFAGRPQRPKDIEDIRILCKLISNSSQEAEATIEEKIKLLTMAGPR